MKVVDAEFVTSAAAGGRVDGLPRDALAQVAMAGRSNVGKSALINALARRTIARTSAAPGKTRLANVYRVTVDGGPGGPGRWSVYLVDLPGYGYARGGSDAAQELSLVAEAYFAARSSRLPARSAQGDSAPGASRQGRGTTDGTLLLVDSRHPGLPSDVQAHRWLSTVGQAPPIVVATKIDKLSRAERARNLRELERVFGTAARPVSATGGEGLDELWKVIASLARDAGGRRTETAR